MTVTDTTQKVQYNPDGDDVTFSTSFSFELDADVVVTLTAADGTETTWVKGTQYTLTGAGTGSAGTVTVVTVPTDYTPASGTKLTIKREPALTQSTSLTLGGPLPSTDIEDAMDRIVHQIQSLDERLDRTMIVPVTENTNPAAMPTKTDRANKYLTFDSAGEPTATDGQSASGTSVTATGTTSARLLADRFAEWINVKDYGALGNNDNDDLAAFNTAAALGLSPIIVPAGTYKLSVPPDSADVYWKFLNGATWSVDSGTWNPRHYEQAQSEPFFRKVNLEADNPTVANGAYAVLGEAYMEEQFFINEYGYQELDGSSELSGSSYTSVSTASRARSSNVATIVTGSAHNLRTGNVMTISGMADASYDDTGVTVTVTNSTTFTYSNTGGDEGTTADVGGTVSGRFARTMSAQNRWRMSHNGEGDCYNLYATAAITNHSNAATMTRWSGQNSGGIMGGQVNAATAEVNLYGLGDITLSDAGYSDVSLIGQTMFLTCSGADAAAYNVPRFGFLMNSNGNNDCDCAFIVQGKFAQGIDVSGATLSDNAALCMLAGDGIYFDATAPDNSTGKFNTQTVGTYFMAKASASAYIGITTNNQELIRLWTDRMEVIPSATPQYGVRVKTGAAATPFASIGQTGTSTLVTAGSGGSDTTNLQFWTAASGTEAVRMTIDTNLAVKPGADASQDLGTASLRWGNILGNTLQITDGISAPTPESGMAVIYVDTSDGDLKIKFSDATVKTIVVDT